MRRILGYMCFIVCIGMVMVSCDWIFSLLAPQPSGQDEETISCTVTYHANGATEGTLPVDDKAYEQGETVTVADSSGNLLKNGYYFAGWNTKADGSGDTYAPGTTFKMGAADVVLYVRWSAVPTYTITYNANGAFGGTVPSSQIIQENALVTVSANVNTLHKNDAPPVTQESFKLLGWNTVADGSGTHYDAGSGSFTVITDTTLYAEWGPYQVRDQGPAGGWIFYDKGSFFSGWRYLEAAPESSEWSSKSWAIIDTHSAISAGGSAVGTGLPNTDNIISVQGGGSTYAGQVCEGLNHNGYGDWFLPSQDELDNMYINLKQHGVGGFANDRYYSSTIKVSNYSSYIQNFGDGSQTGSMWTQGFWIRAARRF